MRKKFTLTIFLLVIAIIFVLMGKSNIHGEGGEERIVFAAHVPPEIFSVDVDGKNLKNLTNHPAFDYNPTASPDGRYIAFISSRNGSPQVFIMDSDGKNPKLLIDDVTSRKPTWSPDSMWVAYIKGLHSVVAVNIKSGETKKLFEVSGAILTDPASWSPDGKKMVFRLIVNKRGDIYTTDIDGKIKLIAELQQLTNNDPEDDGRPSWSPDGKQIVFNSTMDGGGIFVMDSDGANVKQIHKTRAICCPVWSPDGQKIVFSTLGIFVMNSDGSNVRQIFKEGESPTWLRGLSFNVESESKWKTMWGKIKRGF